MPQQVHLRLPNGALRLDLIVISILLLIAQVLNGNAARFPQFDSYFKLWRQMRPQLPPDPLRQHFGAGLRQQIVQVLMIQA